MHKRSACAKKCARQGRQQQWQQQASQQGKQAPNVQRPPRLCTDVCRARQATTIATAGEPAEQAGSNSAETTAVVHKSTQGRAGNNNEGEAPEERRPGAVR